MQAAGFTIARSWAVLAAGSPLAACLLGPAVITLHCLVFSSCFARVSTAGLPQLPICLTPRGCLIALVPHAALNMSLGMLWCIWLSSTTMNHFWVFTSTCFPSPTRYLSLPTLACCRLHVLLAVLSHLTSLLPRSARVLCQMSHRGTLCFAGCHWLVLLWGSTVLWLWA